ncbi:unnamed protein product [Polarella glacialis]|uniref:Uncharacterized protein n=1 Tax=Polarella glacialis TaxID=89957 RepID=A0A813KQ48_POLGL|nr:unnamed protein product [Polarella glacialis]
MAQEPELLSAWPESLAVDPQLDAVTATADAPANDDGQVAVEAEARVEVAEVSTPIRKRAPSSPRFALEPDGLPNVAAALASPTSPKTKKRGADEDPLDPWSEDEEQIDRLLLSFLRGSPAEEAGGEFVAAGSTADCETGPSPSGPEHDGPGYLMHQKGSDLAPCEEKLAELGAASTLVLPRAAASRIEAEEERGDDDAAFMTPGSHCAKSQDVVIPNVGLTSSISPLCQKEPQPHASFALDLLERPGRLTAAAALSFDEAEEVLHSSAHECMQSWPAPPASWPALDGPACQRENYSSFPEPPTSGMLEEMASPSPSGSVLTHGRTPPPRQQLMDNDAATLPRQFARPPVQPADDGPASTSVSPLREDGYDAPTEDAHAAAMCSNSYSTPMPASAGAESEQLAAAEKDAPATRRKGTSLRRQSSAPESEVQRTPRQQKDLQLTPTGLVQIPLDCLGAASSHEGRPAQRPARHRTRPLEHWRNEAQVFERLPGSMLPTVAAVLLLPEESESKLELVVPVLAPPLLGRPAARQPASPASAPSGAAACLTQSVATPPPKRKARSTPSASCSGVKSKEGHKPPAPREEQQPEAPVKRRRGSSEARARLDFGPETQAEANTTASESSNRGPEEQHPIDAPPPKPSSQRPSDALPKPSSQRPVHKKKQRQPQKQAAGRFHRLPLANGSSDPCEIRMGLDTAAWTCCDIRVPPRSISAAETLCSGRAMVMHVVSTPPNSLSAHIDGECIDLKVGDSFRVREGSEYHLANASVAEYAQVKMVLLRHQS